MLHKQPRKSNTKKILTKVGVGLVVIELGLFCGSFFIWSKVNKQREYRLYLHDNYPKVLNVYYSIGEYLGTPAIRETDLHCWKTEGKLPEASN